MEIDCCSSRGLCRTRDRRHGGNMTLYKLLGQSGQSAEWDSRVEYSMMLDCQNGFIGNRVLNENGRLGEEEEEGGVEEEMRNAQRTSAHSRSRFSHQP